ncbi:MAG TPA: ABC transporter substrate-binding protein [Chloroflexota bacterium]|nr:ABC transporter substrate-binding protein [Chloroflexota bacterium]
MDGRGQRRNSRSRIFSLPLVIAVIALMVGCNAAAKAPTAPQASTAPAPAAAPGGPGAASAPPTEASAPAAPGALPSPVSIKVAYSELTAAQTPNWVAEDAGIFDKYGLDVELLYIQSSQTVAAVLAGDVQIALGGGAAAMSSRLGGSDMVIFMALTNYYPYELFVSNDINSPEDLRGKTVGISRFGSSSDVSTRLALRLLGLDPEKDVTLLQTGSLAERMAAMQSGQLAAALASPPYNTRLRRAGLRSILDLSKTGEPALNNVGFAEAGWLKDNDAVAQAFVNAITEAIHYAKANREYTETVMAKYLKLDDQEAVSDSYDFYLGDNLSHLPDLSIDAGKKYLESRADKDPKAATANVADFFDTHFLERTKASGLLERLWGPS